jgi:hypothetical protein
LLPLHCTALVALGQKLANAIQDVYRLRAEAQAAQPKGDKQGALLNLLQKARIDQRHAEGAFTDHVKEHGCTD